MPLFTVKLNAMGDELVDAAGTVYLHTAAPTDVAPTNGRVTGGGGSYASGFDTVAANWTVAAAGDVQNNVAFNFGTATSPAGQIIGWSYYKGSDPYAYGTLPSTNVATGDSFSINANSLQMNGSTS